MNILTQHCWGNVTAPTLLGMDGYLTTAQAADLLGVSARTVYYYARDTDDFPEPERFGRALMWPERPLRQWREKHPARSRASNES